MTDRIAVHRARRPAGWITIETETDAAAAALSGVDQSVVLLDCLTLLVSNLFLSAAAGGAAASPQRRARGSRQRLIESATSRAGELVIVSNEVGSAIVPETPYGRWFRDILGEANMRVANAATSVTLVVAGCSLQLKPGS